MKHDVDYRNLHFCRLCGRRERELDADAGECPAATLKPIDPRVAWLSTPERRYYDDVRFKSVVDLLESSLHRAELTPFELREAVMLAAIHYETRNVREIVVRLNRHGDVEMFRGGDARKAVDNAYERIAALREYLAKTDPHTGEPHEREEPT